MRSADKTIDGVTYRTTVMPADVGMPMAFELAKLVGPALATTVEGIGAALAGAMAEPLVGRAVRDVADRITPESGTDLVKRLLSFTQANGAPIDFNTHFAGRYKQLRDVLAFVVEVNDFRGFFDGWMSEALDGIAAVRLAWKQTVASNPSSEKQPGAESTGGSGVQ